MNTDKRLDIMILQRTLFNEGQLEMASRVLQLLNVGAVSLGLNDVDWLVSYELERYELASKLHYNGNLETFYLP